MTSLGEKKRMKILRQQKPPTRGLKKSRRVRRASAIPRDLRGERGSKATENTARARPARARGRGEELGYRGEVMKRLRCAPKSARRPKGKKKKRGRWNIADKKTWLGEKRQGRSVREISPLHGRVMTRAKTRNERGKKAGRKGKKIR